MVTNYLYSNFNLNSIKSVVLIFLLDAYKFSICIDGDKLNLCNLKIVHFFLIYIFFFHIKYTSN